MQPDSFEDTRHWCGGNKSLLPLPTVRLFPKCTWKFWPPYFSPPSLTLLSLQYYSFLHGASTTGKKPRDKLLHKKYGVLGLPLSSCKPIYIKSSQQQWGHKRNGIYSLFCNALFSLFQDPEFPHLTILNFCQNPFPFRKLGIKKALKVIQRYHFKLPEM